MYDDFYESDDEERYCTTGNRLSTPLPIRVWMEYFTKRRDAGEGVDEPCDAMAQEAIVRVFVLTRSERVKAWRRYLKKQPGDWYGKRRLEEAITQARKPPEGDTLDLE